MKLDTKKLSEQIEDLRIDLKKQRKSKLYYKQRYFYLSEKTPKLFEMVLENKDDLIPIIYKMLSMVDKLNENKDISEDEHNLGTELVDRYVSTTK